MIACDSCSARAKVRASKDFMRLYFCGHHEGKYKDALKAKAFKLSELPEK